MPKKSMGAMEGTKPIFGASQLIPTIGIRLTRTLACYIEKQEAVIIFTQ
jgi:hypothetical protein